MNKNVFFFLGQLQLLYKILNLQSLLFCKFTSLISNKINLKTLING